MVPTVGFVWCSHVRLSLLSFLLHLWTLSRGLGSSMALSAVTVQKNYCLPACSFVAPPLKPSKGSGELRACFAYYLVQSKCDFDLKNLEYKKLLGLTIRLHVIYFSSQNITTPKVQERNVVRKLESHHRKSPEYIHTLNFHKSL